MFKPSPSSPIDAESVRKARKTCDKITETIYVTANEPTLACFRIQEHIHRTIPILLEKKTEMLKNESTLQGILYDIEYTKDSIESLKKSQDGFDEIQRLLKNCIHLKQQADYEENMKRKMEEKLQQPKQELAQIQAQSSSSSSSQTTSNNRRTQSSARSSSNRFQRFSTSFDFANSFPISADIKSLINQFTSKSMDSNDQSQSNNPKTTVTTSKSLYTLPENTDDDEYQTTATNPEKK